MYKIPNSHYQFVFVKVMQGGNPIGKVLANVKIPLFRIGPVCHGKRCALKGEETQKYIPCGAPAPKDMTWFELVLIFNYDRVKWIIVDHCS